jgi:peptide deformylase
MAILEIARMGAPTLREPAEPVADPTAPEIRALVADMLETMTEAGGVGLAAPQVRVPLRVVIFQLPRARVEEGVAEDAEDTEEDPGELPLHVFINPVIEPLDDEQALGWEGCLSLPGMRGLVPRHTRIRYRAFDLDGTLIEGEATGFHARVIQHECDHLDGFVYPMRMTDLSLLGYDSEWTRAMLEDAEAAE